MGLRKYVNAKRIYDDVSATLKTGVVMPRTPKPVLQALKENEELMLKFTLRMNALEEIIYQVDHQIRSDIRKQLKEAFAEVGSSKAEYLEDALWELERGLGRMERALVRHLDKDERDEYFDNMRL